MLKGDSLDSSVFLGTAWRVLLVKLEMRWLGIVTTIRLCLRLPGPNTGIHDRHSQRGTLSDYTPRQFDLTMGDFSRRTGSFYGSH